MHLSSDSITNGQPIPATFAAGNAEGFAPNRNPQLAWHDVPAGTRSFALLCIDPDVGGGGGGGGGPPPPPRGGAAEKN